jgi:hypothetical protein
MLPANRDDRTVHVHRSLDVDEEDLLDAITAYAEAESFDIDRRFEGPGLLFVRTSSGDLFKKGDTLQVVITATNQGHDVELVADIPRAIANKQENRNRRVIRGYALAGLFAVLGTRGLIHNGVDVGDFVLFAIGAGFGRRAFSRSQSASEKVDELQRKVANELNAICDDAERA